MIVNYLLIVIASIFGSIGQVYFKLSNGLFFSFNFIYGAMLYGIATLLYVYALKEIPLSIGYPIIALSYIFVSILSHFVLGEPLTIYDILGGAMIITGILMITQL